ncbi:sigma-70 family rna polymerase sigma factor : RNA polymerase sigma factor, sigma-70 family OS=Singulisphaera acidiphila (strain ATCC BAA-1392 / DSM 18658 / VKM B-2454 / MOB10) GN=Sinac_2507 PE=4 SV=1: Sigma70_r2: Sigma70_r4_2: Poly_export [Gemmata massiliana]|uniref:RNA polymerase sigma-70 region 2 domain-containing protein n=1 Tax=Gemmata massiliana TaxID=1210884 RepID=A0A6P2DEK9_9BACT|nr:sigma-70 family RNA polymerase sigma factor [Gemmata massiliana]VTR99928.1 sigma-70 family rna polymerase sigma factor : RNA polymerase sigma factor, sigma-70 family OS=Singulisphaera acidiphila (strain ATCC BAA-1392 / DSM 18658 / VKM B-2454 / MOB10) GN=Sinac_2507 PE=4 SV=1: Sigma70_r2: Sigma70_r4_2: Poly_export [Gemmata massiliana]
MAANDARTVSQFRKLTAEPEEDARLLERFHAHTDAAAFAELVRRHGPMVLGVCRRVLGNGPDADDAFQGAFLVLARKAGSVRNGRSVANWLFGVARFIALRARDKDARRRTHEAQAALQPRTGTEPDTELIAAVEEELHRLPERYRVPLVACFLQSRTQEDAAKELRCSLSTLRRRLEQGQELLRRRLIGRGAVPALGAIAGEAHVSATVTESTTALAVAFIHNESRAVPATALAERALATMARTKLKAAFTAAVLVIGLCGGVAWQLVAAPLSTLDEANQQSVPKPTDPTTKDRATKPIDPPAKDIKPADPAAKGRDTLPNEDRIKPGDRLTIRVRNGVPDEPIDGQFEVEASGKVPLGPIYGRIKVSGLTLEEAEDVILKYLQKDLRQPLVSVTRYNPPEGRVLELRVQQLEREVRELRSLVEELRKQK